MKKVVVTNQSAVAVGGVPPGGCTTVDTDAAGVPMDPFWRRRLRDAALDGSLRTEPEEVAPAPSPVASAHSQSAVQAPITKKDKPK